MGVGALVYGSANLALLDTNAALTAPTNYNYSYRQSNVDTVSGNNWAIRNNGGSSLSILPIYNGSYDGIYYSYTNTTTLLNGFTITTTFNRSTTSWTTVSSSPYTARPNNSASSIGSNNTVGSINSKFYFEFNNQTNKHYFLYLDFSSTTTSASNTDFQIYVWYETNQLGTYNVDRVRTYTQQLIAIYLPSYTNLQIFRINTSNETFFDAFYLQDLGVSDAWINGYDVGYSDGIALTGMGNIFELAFNTVSTIFNIQVLGTLTLGTIVIAPIAIALLWFILGIVSGVGTGGKKK